MEIGLNGVQECADAAKVFMDEMNMSELQKEAFKNLIIKIIEHSNNSAVDVGNSILIIITILFRDKF